MASTKFRDLPPLARAAIMILGAGQVGLAIAAWLDLRRRPASQVRGPKLVWAAVIALNTVGPLSYFRWGRLRAPR